MGFPYSSNRVYVTETPVFPSAGTKSLGATTCLMSTGSPPTPVMEIMSLTIGAGGRIQTMFSPISVSSRSVAVAFPAASTGTAILSVPPMKPAGEPTVNVTSSAMLRLSTTFPYLSTIRTVIFVFPPAVTFGSYQRLTILCGAAWSICCSPLPFRGSIPSRATVAVIVAVPLRVPGVKAAAALPALSVTTYAGEILP